MNRIPVHSTLLITTIETIGNKHGNIIIGEASRLVLTRAVPIQITRIECGEDHNGGTVLDGERLSSAEKHQLMKGSPLNIIRDSAKLLSY